MREEILHRLQSTSSSCSALFEFDPSTIKYRNSMCFATLIVDESERYFDLQTLVLSAQAHGLRIVYYGSDEVRSLVAMLHFTRARRSYGMFIMLPILCLSVALVLYYEEELWYLAGRSERESL